jgi:hypothetical protein
MTEAERKTPFATRRRFKQDTPLKERLLSASHEAAERAKAMPEGIERRDLLRFARQTKLTAEMDDWLSSPGLRAPK